MIAKRESVLNETLLYNIRRFRESDEYICGMLLREQERRTGRIVKAAIRGVDRLGKTDIAMQVEVESVSTPPQQPSLPLS